MTEKRIAKLSPLLINQIAAGEVVTRPASVVKELIENAIDAHATRITIHIEQGGLGLIQVADNGTGIHPDDMTLAVTRHATSKLADVGQLTGIDSLGFRGEALASICAVSHLTLTSSHTDTGIGQQLALSGEVINQAPSDAIACRPVVKQKGTTVSVRDLYYNVPARRSHLKSIATEFAQIEQVVQRLAISFADIDLELYHQNKLRFSLTKESTLKRLENALNLPLEPIATPFELSLTALQPAEMAKITGWLFVTAHHQDLPRLIYINQRLVTDFAISQAIAKSVRQVGLEQASLGYALFFELPKDWINVNIHPSKQQVKIQPLSNILALLNQKLLEHLKHWQLKSAEKSIQNVGWVEQSDTQQIYDNSTQQTTVGWVSPAVSGITHPDKEHLFSKGLPQKVSENLSNYDFISANVSPNDNGDKTPQTPQILGQMTHEKLGEVSLIFYEEKFYLFKSENVENMDFDLSLDKAISQLTLQDVVSFMLSRRDFDWGMIKQSIESGEVVVPTLNNTDEFLAWLNGN